MKTRYSNNRIIPPGFNLRDPSNKFRIVMDVGGLTFISEPLTGWDNAQRDLDTLDQILVLPARVVGAEVRLPSRHWASRITAQEDE